MRDVWIIARLGLREAVRRRVLPVVVGLSLVFLVLFWLAVGVVRDRTAEESAGGGLAAAFAPALDDYAAGLLLGMASFATLFLGATLGIFLTAGTIRGDAERGLLQPLVVRPVGRLRVLAGRWIAATVVAVPYAIVLELGAIGIMKWRGDYTAPTVLLPSFELGLAVGLVALMALTTSVLLSQVAAGIGSFMAVGAGLVGGLIGQIGDGLDSRTLERAADVVSTALPFQGLYQDALSRLTPATTDAIQLGPLGGAERAATWFGPWIVLWIVVVGAAGVVALARRDL